MNYREIAKDYNDAFGFNVIPLTDKVPKLDWAKWQTEDMGVSQIDSLGWNSKTNGIGAISGINNLRCLDFDNVTDTQIVYNFAVELGLGKNYLWIVKSGSRKGFHIWFKSEDEENYLDGLGGIKAYYKIKPKDSESCDHIELRWKNCQTVLPPSKHPSGNVYEFVNLHEEGLPHEEPKNIWIGKVLETIKKLCVINEPVCTKAMPGTKGQNEYEKKLLKDAVDFIKGSIDNYEDWYKIGLALASLGEDGRQHFVDISSGNPKYNESENEINRKYDGFLKDYRGDITLGSFYEIAKKFGWVKPRKHFWRIDEGKANIIRTDLIDLLEEEGFGKMFVGISPIYIRIKENIVSEVTSINIKDFVLAYINEMIKDNWIKQLVKESIIKTARNIFCDAYLEFLKTMDLSFIKDEKDKAYFFFENCFVEVTKSRIIEKPYKDLNGVIWEKQRIKRGFVKGSNATVYEIFLNNICRKEPKRLNALKSTIGYLLHRYKNPACSKAIVFIDEKLSANAFGRSGKSLVANAISQLRNLLKLDGKNFQFDKSFAFQSVNLDTEIIFFDDVRNNFPFERLFSIITEGLTVEKKNKGEFHIPFEEAPKIIITTNHSIKGSDDSSSDRQFVIEFSDYYDAKHKPTDDFGELFFSEWSKKEFNKFDNFMIECCQFYLSVGLSEYEYVNLTKKRLIDETSQEFEEFIKENELGIEYNKKNLFRSFREEYEDFEKLPQRTFTKWTKIYANLYDLDVDERKSGTERFIVLTKKGEQLPKNEQMDL
ncbi:MAG: PriCT-2 domain-containing protein [Bacteroidetes bacterium]|nr:PriCT-2 domain-containing protein [Bacteroidota bacterium]MBU1115027.1 PriCT-2 domain-containing protein [Bacteroidota bacterium]MBU1799519.1 PriCT-2 domain-containing protein [Bacteroidota bacterium]